jgi:acyl-CoA dehydrogenase
VIETLSLQPLPLQAEALRAEVRNFLEVKLHGVPSERRARSWLGFDADFSRALGERGWIGMALPQEYGGGGRDAFARFVLVEELLACGAPVSAHWIAERQSAPMVLRFGTEAQKHFFVPRVCRGELFFCIGMSEPQSGSDLASVRTRATPTRDGWRLKGQKIWTTNADHSHWMIALVRTSGTPEDRQAGLSQLLIDMKAPGVTVRPIEDLTGDRHFSEVFFDDVELPHDALIGEEGTGWKQVNTELALERSGPERLYSSMVLLDTWIDHLREMQEP